MGGRDRQQVRFPFSCLARCARVGRARAGWAKQVASTMYVFATWLHLIDLGASAVVLASAVGRRAAGPRCGERARDSVSSLGVGVPWLACNLHPLARCLFLQVCRG